MSREDSLIKDNWLTAEDAEERATPLTSNGSTNPRCWRFVIGPAAALVEVERTTLRCPPFNPKAEEDVAKTVRRASGAIFMVAVGSVGLVQSA